MTRRATWIIPGAILALLPLAGCMQAEKTADNGLATGQAAVQAQMNPTLSTSDAYFIDQAARAGMAEVQEGQLAEKQARRANVRSFATTMVKDHGWINERLTMLAENKKITPPTAPNEVQTQMVSSLQGLHGSAFDRQYLDQQATMHQSAVNLYRTEAAQGTDPDVKSFAAKMLPRLEEHLTMVEKLGGHLPKS